MQKFGELGFCLHTKKNVQQQGLRKNGSKRIGHALAGKS
jgi:hypothetical protein